MKTVNGFVFYCLLMSCSLVLVGCGKKVDEEKPLSQVRAEANKMSVADLRAKALAYKEALVAKGAELDELTAKFAEIPMAEKLGAEAKALHAELDSIRNSVSALKERFQIYYGKLREKDGDLSGLEI